MLKFILLFLFSGSVFALTLHTATYALSISGFEIANEQRVLSQKNQVYTYTENAQTIGLAKLIKDYQVRAYSEFSIDEFGLNSKHYRLLERDGKKVKKDIDIHPQNQQIDPLSLFLALTYALEKNPTQKNFYFWVNDGKKVKKQHYQRVKNDDTNLTKVINIQDDIQAYFAKDKHYLPVLIQRLKFSYRLKQVTFAK